MRDDQPSTTAEIVCFFRAADRRRPPHHRVIDDPYAEYFLSPPFRSALTTTKVLSPFVDRLEQLELGLATYALTRHRAIDDALVSSLGSVEQIVLLGAGYDSRAYRLPVGARPVFELDHPATSRRKAGIARERAAQLPSADIRRVTVNFARESLEEKLLASGFDRTRPSFFVWEGVSMYLTRQAIASTLATVRALSTSGSFLAMDYWFLLDAPDATSTLHRISAGFVHLVGEPITFALHPEDAGSFMERSGFEITQLTLAKELEEKYVRDGRKVYPATYVVVARPSPKRAHGEA
ncbi:MAG: SAM-dependent methyltransferase [Deltaproteobacteria bacterium]|nr:SAM-dependent methyltransferase [Deltaproteobacteria bacterium]